MALVSGLCPSLTSDVLAVLKTHNITNVLDFITMNPKQITAICGLAFKKVLAIRRVLIAQYSSFPVAGIDLYNEVLSTVAVLPVGCKALDDALNIGIYTGEVTEISGISAAGKTQLCLHFATFLSASLQQNVIYIDTSGGFSLRRITEILKHRFPDQHASSCLRRIKICRCLSYLKLKEVIDELRGSLQSPNTFFAQLKTVIIDSISSVLSSSAVSTSYVAGMSEIQSMGREINRLAKDFSLAVIVTNDLVSTMKSKQTLQETFNKKTTMFKPALGLCWSFVPSVRLELRPVKEPTLWNDGAEGTSQAPLVIHVKLVNSPRATTQSLYIAITPGGVSQL